MHLCANQLNVVFLSYSNATSWFSVRTSAKASAQALFPQTRQSASIHVPGCCVLGQLGTAGSTLNTDNGTYITAGCKDAVKEEHRTDGSMWDYD